MSQFKIAQQTFSVLKDRIVVLSGGATGIGAATVRLLADQGAKVVFGDINKKDAEELVTSLQANGKEVSFASCDVTKYDDVCQLFKTAHAKYGHIDHSVSCAGIFERGNWFDPKLNIDNISQESGDTSTLDITVLGTAYFSRVAVVYMRDHFDQGQDKSLTLMSSVNAFRESPGLHMYQTAKHAVQGFMRAARKPLYERDHIRVNTVNPGVTQSPMTDGIYQKFRDAGLFWQPASAVANFIVAIMAKPDMNGKAIYIEGSEGWEFEDSFYAEQPRWLGEEPTRRMRVNAEAVNKGALSKD